MHDIRCFKLIDAITAAAGRTSKLDPGALFPSLKGIGLEDVENPNTAELQFEGIRHMLEATSL